MKTLHKILLMIAFVTLLSSCQTSTNPKQLLSNKETRKGIMDTIANNKEMMNEMTDAMMNTKNGKMMMLVNERITRMMDEMKKTDETNKIDGMKNMMKGFKSNIEKETLENENFRKVLYTSKYSQLVLMSLKPKEEIGIETHEKTDQFFRFEGGKGKCIIDGNEYEINVGDAVIVPAGAKHNVINISDKESLKLYTIYSPPKHKDGIIYKTKEEAANEEKFDGKTTE